MDTEKASEEYVVIQIRLPMALKARLTEAARRLTEETPGSRFSFNGVAVAALAAWVERAERKWGGRTVAARPPANNGRRAKGEHS